MKRCPLLNQLSELHDQLNHVTAYVSGPCSSKRSRCHGDRCTPSQKPYYVEVCDT